MIKYHPIPRKKHQIILSAALTDLHNFYYGRIIRLPLRKIGITAGCVVALLGGALLMKSSDVPVPPEQVVELIGQMDTPELHPDRPYVATLKKLLSDIAGGSSVNTSDSEGNTALILAARLNNRPATCWLVARGADARRRNDAGFCALDYARDEHLRALLSSCMCEDDDLSDTARNTYALTSVDWNSHLRGGLNPERLRECADQLKAGGDATLLAADVLPQGRDADIYLAYLLRHGADLPQARRMVEREHLELPQEITTYLQALGYDTAALARPTAPQPTELTDPSAKDAEGNTALFHAIAAHDAERVQELIAAGAEVNLRNKANDTPLLLAIDNCTAANGPEIVRLLVTHGADMEALRNDENAITQLALHAGALATKPNFERHLPALEQTLQHLVDAKVYMRPHLLLLLPKARPGVTISPHLAKFAERLIAAGTDAKRESFGHRTSGALSTVGCCDAGMAQKLIDMGVPVNRRAGDGSTPLMGAQNAEIARVFINAGADINAADNAGRTALDYAIAAQDPERVKLLLEGGAAVNHADSTGVTPLQIAVSSCAGENGLAIVRRLLNAGANLNSMDHNKHTPLHLAIVAQNPELTKILLAAGADVNARSAQDYTPLLLAIDRCTESMHGEGVEIVQRLLKAGAKPTDLRGDERGTQNAYTLTLRRIGYDTTRPGYAVRYVPTLHHVLETMLDSGIEPVGHSGALMPPGMREIVLPSELAEIARTLVDRKLGVNSSLYGGFTALMSIGSLDADVTKKLLDENANPNARANLNWTPLHSAQTPEVAKALLAAGAEPNIASDWQNRGTPLRNAVRMAPEATLPELAKALVEGGADVKGNGWDIMRDLSQRELSFRTFRKLAELFTKAGADINTAWDGLYPAKLLISLGASVSENMLLNPAYARDAAELVKAGADINARDGEGNTPLIKLVTARNDIVDRLDMDAVVKLYLKLGADVSLVTRDGSSAARRARRQALLALARNGVDTSERIIHIMNGYGNPAFQETIPDKMRLEYLRIVILEQKHSIPQDEIARQLTRATRPELAEFLLDIGGDPNTTASDGTTLLMSAGAHSAKLAERLLHAGAKPSQARADGNTALHFASAEVAPILIKAGADPTVRNKAGRTPLEDAIYRLSPEEVKTQLAIAGIDVKAQKPHRVLLNRHDVSLQEHNVPAMKVLRLLRDAGADMNIIWLSPLVYKAVVTAPEMLSLGADAHWRDKRGRSTLMMSPTQPGILYQDGHVDMNATDNDGNTALMHMVQGPFDHAYLAREYAKRGADFSIRNKKGLTALDIARRSKYAETAVPALQPFYAYDWKKPAVVDIICPASTSPEQEALRDRLCRIQDGADVNTTDADGRSALMLAVAGKNRPAACWLIAKGADVTLKDKEGKSAYDMTRSIAMRELLSICAAENEPLTDKERSDLKERAATPETMHKTLFDYGRYVEKLSILLKGGATPSKPGDDGSLLVEHEMPLETLAYLLRRGYDPNTRRADGKLPARNIAEDMSADLKRLLLAMGMQPDTKDKHATLCAMLACDDTENVKELLKQEPELIKSKTPAGAPLLSLAQSGEMVRVLVAAGANAKEKDLLNRFTSASADTVRALLDAGATIPAAEAGKFSLLHQVGNAELIPLLVQAGADVNHPGFRGLTPLHRAAADFQADKVAALLEAGADVNAKDEDDATALLSAFPTNASRLFIGVGSWVNSSYYPYKRAFAEAELDMDRVLRMLLDAGADPADIAWCGVTAKYGKEDPTTTSPYLPEGELEAAKRHLFRTLMERKIPLHQDVITYVQRGSYDDPLTRDQRNWLANTLLEAGLDAKSIGLYDRATTLMLLGRYDADIIKRLLKNGADPKAKDRDDRTALHEACTLEAVEALLAAKVDVNAYSADHGTPICTIVSKAESDQLVSMVELLLKAGAKTHGVHEGTSWDAIRDLGEQNELSPETFLKVAKLLTKAGSDPREALNSWQARRYIAELAQLGVDFLTSGKESGGTFLHTLPGILSADVLKKLMQIGVDLNAVDNNGNTALMVAAEKGSEKAVSLLLAAGADSDIRNKDGKTALDLAKQKQRTKIVKQLEEKKD